LPNRPIPFALEVNVSPGQTPATIRSWCYDCRQLRKIRYTYIDAGESAQVFNGVIYPTHNYDLPLLGIHLLSLSKKKIWVVLDFGPLFRDEAYIAKYVLAAYLDLVDRAAPVTSGAKLDNILQAQLLYLRYRAEKTRPGECLSGSTARNGSKNTFTAFCSIWNGSWHNW
jgi:hypothetical protein